MSRDRQGLDFVHVAVATVAVVLLATCENPQPPTLCGTIPEQTIVVGETATVGACFDDANGDTLTYGAATSDPGVATVRVSGNRVTVTGVTPGAALVTVTATDVTGLHADQQFRVLIPNRAPVAVGAIASHELPAGESATVDVSAHFTDPDGQALSFEFSVSDETVVSISATGPVVTIMAEAKGTATVTVTATDPGGLSATLSFQSTVPNRTPESLGSMPEQTVEVGGTATMEVTSYFSDPDGDALAYTAATSDPAVIAVSVADGSVMVEATAKGQAVVTVTATDTEGLTATHEFMVTVPNQPPLAVGTMAERTLQVGETAVLELSGHFSDPDGDALAYAVTSSDEAVAAASVSGGVLTVAAIGKGTISVTITATDTEGLAATQEFAVTVPNRAPIAGDAIAERTIEVDGSAALELSDHFSDPDGDALGYAATSSDEAVAVVSVSGTTLTVTAIAKGGASVLVTATDTEGVAATQEFPVTVPNRPPLPGESIPGHDIAIGETATLELSGHFSDPDGDDLVYAATSSEQAVAVVSVSEGTLTISVIAKGGALVTVTATDPEGLAAAQEFAVSAPNRARLPVGSIAARTLDVGKIATLELSGHFSDPDGDVLTYAATVSDPEVAGISVVDGLLTIAAVARGEAAVTVAAKDTEGLEAVKSFTVTVPNRAPLGIGTFPRVRLRKGGIGRVDPSPAFSDPDDDPLAFESASSDLGVARTWVSGGEVLVRAVNKGTAIVTITAVDAEGLNATRQFEVEVRGSTGSDPNRRPVTVAGITAQAMEEGGTKRFNASDYFADPDNDALQFTAASSNATVASATASGTRIAVQAVGEGAAAVTITASDPGGLKATMNFSVTVSPDTTPNRPPIPVGSINKQDLEEGDKRMLEAYSFFDDPDDDDLEFTAETSDPEVVKAKVSEAEVELEAVAPGTTTVTVTAVDPDGLVAEQDFGVAVMENTGVNRAPVVLVSFTAQNLEEGDSRTWDAAPYFTDPDNDALEFTAESSNTGVATVTVSDDQLELEAVGAGTGTVTVTAEDPEDLSVSTDFGVTIETPGPNQPPRVKRAVDDRTLLVDMEHLVQPWKHFEDPDDEYESLTFTGVSSNPSVIEIVRRPPSTLVYSRSLAQGQATVTIIAEDPDGLTAELSFQLTVGNTPPGVRETPEDILSSPGEIDTLTMNSTFRDNDIGDELRYAASSSNTNVATATIEFSGLYGYFERVMGVAAGEATITVTATDVGGLKAEASFVVTVDSNRPPTQTTEIPDTTVGTTDTVVVILSRYFSDPDGDDLTYTALAGAWYDVSMSADTLTLVPTETKGIAVVGVTVTDPDGRSVKDYFFICNACSSQEQQSSATGGSIENSVFVSASDPVRSGTRTATGQQAPNPPRASPRSPSSNPRR